jgi:hypothetical protein
VTLCHAGQHRSASCILQSIMPATTSTELRERIVQWFYDFNLPVHEIVLLSGCSQTTVHRILHLYRLYCTMVFGGERHVNISSIPWSFIPFERAVISQVQIHYESMRRHESRKHKNNISSRSLTLCGKDTAVLWIMTCMVVRLYHLYSHWRALSDKVSISQTESRNVGCRGLQESR